MGFISDEDIEQRVSSPDNLMNRLTIHEIDRSHNTPHVPMEIRKVTAILTNEGESPKDIASAFSIDRRTAYHYKSGETSTGKVPELQKVINETKEKLGLQRLSAEDLAINALLTSLNILPEKLKTAKSAKTISGVAKDMAIIANQMADSNRNPDGSKANTVHLHLYAPKQKKVEDYDVIDV